MSETQRITYPISPDYVAGRWTVERALAEIVANAIDEDPNPSITCVDGIFICEDMGEGLHSRDLVLGISKKSSSQIGQFGEGLKIAAMVMARTKRIKECVIETVGFTIRPLITTEAFHALGEDDPVELLAFDITPNTRTLGTKVTVVGISDEQCKKVTDRFLALTDPAYTFPEEPGRLLRDRPGEIYVCGVFVQKRNDFHFGYDLADKTMQNRDRSVVESWALQRAITGVISQVEDEKTLRSLVKKLIAGEIANEEEGFILNGSAAYKKAMAKIGASLYKDKLVCYQDPYNEEYETLLDLQDRGYKLVKSDRLNPHQANTLFKDLGVPSVKSLRQRAPKKQLTEWLKRNKLSDIERENLETAISLIKKIYGRDALGEVEAYEATRMQGVDEELHFGGFYMPASGRIGIQRLNLRSLQNTLDVLLHEMAHRVLHKERRTYEDRTREFEWQLGTLGTQALLKLHALGALDTDLLEGLPDELSAEKQEVKTEKTPSGMARKLIAARADEKKLTRKVLAEQTGLSNMMIAKMRTSCESSLWTVPSLEETKKLTDLLGLDAHVIWLALYSSKLTHVTRNAKGRLYGKGRVGDFLACIEHVEGFGPEWAEAREQMRAQLEGTIKTLTDNLPSSQVYARRQSLPRGDEKWLDPYKKLMSREIARVSEDTLVSA
jgi:hypothetical protein